MTANSLLRNTISLQDETSHILETSVDNETERERERERGYLRLTFSAELPRFCCWWQRRIRGKVGMGTERKRAVRL